jgi:teichuronic acid exporter
MTDITPAPEPIEPPGGAPGNSRDRRDGHFVRSLAWVGGIRTISQAASWLSTIVVFRALGPSATGLVGMAGSFLGLVNLVNEFGVSGAIVFAKELPASRVAQINSFSLCFGVLCFLFGVIASGPVATFYRTPEVRLVVILLSLNFILGAFQTVPLAMLRRELEFRSVAINDAIQAAVLAVVSVTLAYLGAGYWTLVIANLLGAAIRAAAAVWRYPVPFAVPRFDELRSTLGMGSQLVVTRLAWYVYSNADYWVVGRTLGTVASGAYGLAWNFATMPIEKISSVVMSVAPAYLASFKDNVAEGRRFMLLLIEGTVIAALPATIGLAAVADVLVPVFLGPEWSLAIGPLRILAIYTTFRIVTSLLPPVLFSAGRMKAGVVTSIISAVLMPISFIVGIRWGLVGVAVAWATVYPLVSIPLYVVASRVLEMKLSQMLRAIGPAVGFTTLMLAAVLATRLLVEGRVRPPIALAAEIAAGVVTYAVCIRLGYWNRIRQLYRAFREPAPHARVPTGAR